MTNETGRKPAPQTKKHIARQQREQQQTRLILYTFVGILGAVLLLLAYGYFDVKYFQLNRPVATVNGVEISTRSFEARVRMQRQQLLYEYNTYAQYQQFFGMDMSAQLQQIEASLASPASIGQAVIDQMIEEEIIRQEAAKRGITVSEEELQKAIEGEFGFYPNGSPTPTITPTNIVMPDVPAEAFEIVTQTPLPSPTSAFTSTPESAPTTDPAVTGTVEPTATLTPTATLEIVETPPNTPTPRPTATPYTEEGFKKEYQGTVSLIEKLGLTETQYRELIEQRLLREKLMEAIAEEAGISDTEEQVWARHILVSDEATALSIIEKLNAGEDFAALALEFSQDTGSAAQGGDLGWFGKGAMVPEFETAAFELKNPGDISAPVQSQFGYHIIQLIAKQDRPRTASQIEQAKQAAFDEWLTKAREEEYKVEISEFWMERVPTEPSFQSLATEAAMTQQADTTATAKAEDEATPAP